MKFNKKQIKHLVKYANKREKEEDRMFSNMAEITNNQPQL